MQVRPIESAMARLGGKLRYLVLAGLGVSVVGTAALVDLRLLDARQAELAAITTRVALAAAKDPDAPEAAAEAALGADAAAVRISLETGTMAPGDGRADDRFRPAAEGGSAVRIFARARTRLPVSGLVGVRFALQDSAIAVRDGVATVVLTGRPPTLRDRIPTALIGALAGGGLSFDQAAWNGLFRATVDVIPLAAALEEKAREHGGSVPIAEVMRAAAEIQPLDATADRDIWLTLAKQLASSEVMISPEALIRSQVHSDGGSTDLSARLTGPVFLGEVLRAAAVGRTVSFELEEPAEGLARIRFVLSAEDNDAPLLVGSEGARAGLPTVRLAVQATLTGSTLPSAPRFELPILLDLHGGDAVVDAVRCNAADPAADAAMVSARPVQARLRFGAGGDDGTAGEAMRPATLIDTPVFTAWISGDTGVADEPPARLAFAPNRSPGDVQSVNAALGLEDVFARFVSAADVVVTVHDETAVGGAAVRDEVTALVTDHAAVLARMTGEVLSTLGIVPGELAVAVGAVSCNRAKLVP